MMTHSILHVVSSLQTGGAEKFVVNLSLQQLKEGHEVLVFSYGRESDALNKPLRDSGISVLHPAAELDSRLKQAIFFAGREVVHIHSPAVIRALAPVFPFLLRTRVIYTIHGEVDPSLSLLRASHQVARTYVDQITAVSSAARDSVDRRYGWPRTLVRILPNGTQLPAAPLPLASAADRLRLGCVSRLISLKNIPLLFKALSLLSPSDRARLEVNIIGDGPERSLIESEAAALSEVEVRITGNLESEADIYRRFDVLINCSNTEGLPMTIIEAMSYGRPVVATAVGAVPTAIEEGNTGWLYPVGDAQTLATLLKRLLEDRSLALTAGERARHRALKTYSIESVSRSFAALYTR